MSYSERFDEALVLAARLHRAQTRKGSSIPYVTHLLAVAAIVGENGGSEDEVIAALLHDAIEDQGGEAARRLIRERFGDSVVDLVDGCTDADQIPKPPWRARKEAHLAALATAPRGVLLISAADKLHNARSLLADLGRHGARAWEKFSGGKEGTLWHYRSIVSLLAARLGGPIVDDLQRVVEAIERIASDSAG